MRSGIPILPWLLLIMVVFVIYRLLRWIRNAVDRSIKAKKDLARSVADVSEKLERIEQKVKSQDQPKS